MLRVDITKRLDCYDLEIHIESDSDALGIFGASGAGKSMTLKCIAGIEKPDSGRIELNGRVLFDSAKRIDVKPRLRGVGYLFQEYALFPNMTVAGNIMAGLHRLPRRDRKAKAEELMERFRISRLSSYRPDSLSGGERQRVALARVFASDPELILLDEPFSSLDTVLKCELIPEMKQTMQAFGKGCVTVSHDVAELCALCDTVATVSDGKSSPIMPIADFAADISEHYKLLNIETFIS